MGDVKPTRGNDGGGEFFAPVLQPANREGLRYRLYRLMFHHESRSERNFDLALIAIIVASVLVVLLDSDPEVKARWHFQLYLAEWVFTLLFALEYSLRIWVVREPLRYARSFLGIVDLLAILPTFLSLLFPASASLTVVRILRLLRIFRILKLVKYSDEAGLLTHAVIFGALMYVVEGPQHGFVSIPTGMYWAVVTMATVGYGDLSPATGLGRFLTSMLIIIGYSIIVVPTGIYTAELARTMRSRGRVQLRCPQCSLGEHDDDAWFCRKCGEALPHVDNNA